MQGCNTLHCLRVSPDAGPLRPGWSKLALQAAAEVPAGWKPLTQPSFRGLLGQELAASHGFFFFSSQRLHFHVWSCYLSWAEWRQSVGALFSKPRKVREKKVVSRFSCVSLVEDDGRLFLGGAFIDSDLRVLWFLYLYFMLLKASLIKIIWKIWGGTLLLIFCVLQHC